MVDITNDFYETYNAWKSETMILSDPGRITDNDNYHKLVKNARRYLSLIIHELRRLPSNLVWVLEEAFPDGPEQDYDGKFDFPSRAKAWISWAEDGWNQK